MISGLGLPVPRVKKLIDESKKDQIHLEKKAASRTIDDIMNDYNQETENNK